MVIVKLMLSLLSGLFRLSCFAYVGVAIALSMELSIFGTVLFAMAFLYLLSLLVNIEYYLLVLNSTKKGNNKL